MEYLRYLIFITFALFSCRKEHLLSSEEYFQTLRENKNIVQKIIHLDKLVCELNYVPVKSMAFKELGGEYFSDDEYAEKIADLNGFSYFVLKIYSEDNSTNLLKYDLQYEEQYYMRLKYFSFDFQNRIKLVCDTDSSDCKLFHYERSNGLVNHETFLMGFENPLRKQNQELKIIIDGKDMDVGDLEFVFDWGKLEEIEEM